MDGIEALTNHTLAELNAIFEFNSHTNLAYQVFEDKAPNNLVTVTMATNILNTKQDLLPLYLKYRNGYLLTLSFQHTVTLFEAFFFDLLRLLLIEEPSHIAVNKKIDVEIALSAPDRASLISIIIDRELNELKYAKVVDWFIFLNKVLRRASITQEEVLRIVEIKATRDIIVHNSDIVNKIYITKTGNMARYSEGEAIDIPPIYFNSTCYRSRHSMENASRKQTTLSTKPCGVTA
ncbi:MAG: hypothetical protein JO316_10835 [Abitibacteriaceae bacterium]|nr:hypothetical protein [Abditibacteriaceae bacterium]MBV9865839.1 hypothetical protein [Abditibacteriaceae bacterium]